MPTDASAIRDLSKEIASLAESLENEDAPLDSNVRKALVNAAEKLAIATREPEENVYHIATQIAHTAAVRSLISMGVFEALPIDGRAVSVSTLAPQLKVNEELLNRLLRACTSTHLFANPSPSHYAHTALSLAYTSPSHRAMAAQVYDFTCKGVFALPDFLSAHHYSTAGSYTDGPFQLGANTPLGFWEYLSAEPSRMQLFSTGMRSSITISQGKQRSGPFPFGAVLAADPCTADEVAIVDVGGGYGQVLEAIRADWPDLRGRLVLQDLAHVLADARAQGLSASIETRAGSFFEDQGVKGARIYYFRRIFHDWNQEKGREILERTRGAMNELSRVVIADMVVPEVNAPREMALQDLNMMSFGGMERSASQWARLIESAGLVLRNIWLGTDGAKHAVIEAVLPEFQGHDVEKTEGSASDAFK